MESFMELITYGEVRIGQESHVGVNGWFWAVTVGLRGAGGIHVHADLETPLGGRCRVCRRLAGS